MKVLVTTKGRAPDSAVDPRFGRAELFAVVDTDTGKLEVVSNDEAREASQGAGVKAAELAASLGIEAVITGHCGPKAFSALRSAGIRVITGADGTVAEAVEAFERGRLKPADAPDVRGHWA